jgi:hypothetical protein
MEMLLALMPAPTSRWLQEPVQKHCQGRSPPQSSATSQRWWVAMLAQRLMLSLADLEFLLA